MVGDHAVAAIIARWKLAYEQAIRERDEARVQLDTLRDRVADDTSIINDAIQAQIAQRHTAERERDDARVVADRLLRSLMAAARGDQPPPDGIDCDEVRTIATLHHERDEARVQLAAELARPRGRVAGAADGAETVLADAILAIQVGAADISERCEVCGSAAGQRCYGNGPMTTSHSERRTAARRRMIIDLLTRDGP